MGIGKEEEDCGDTPIPSLTITLAVVGCWFAFGLWRVPSDGLSVGFSLGPIHR